MISHQEIKDAASVILHRPDLDTPKILMGKRGPNAVFMPSMYVFPGGSLEPTDFRTTFSTSNQVINFAKLSLLADPKLGKPLLNCALRELNEETGLQVQKGDLQDHSMTFILRAITPPGMPRRFDTRFFLIRLNDQFDSNQFSNFRNASGELSDLKWFGFEEALTLDIPAITRNVIKFVISYLDQESESDRLPFYREGSLEELTYL